MSANASGEGNSYNSDQSSSSTVQFLESSIRDNPSQDVQNGHFTEDEIDMGMSREREYFCGIGKFRPKWMQVFRNAKFFTFILCLYSCIEGGLVSG